MSKVLKAGFLVVGGVSQRGCIRYVQDGYQEARNGNLMEADWKTHKRVQDVEEQARLTKAGGLLVHQIRKLGVSLSSLGVFVPVEEAGQLETALKGIRGSVDEYNRTAVCTRLSCSWAVFEVGETDGRFARILYDRAVGLLESVSEAIRSGNVQDLRRLLGEVKSLENVVPEDLGVELVAMVKDARLRAKKASIALKEAGEGADAAAMVQAAFDGSPVDGFRARVVEIADSLEDITVTEVPPVETRATE